MTEKRAMLQLFSDGRLEFSFDCPEALVVSICRRGRGRDYFMSWDFLDGTTLDMFRQDELLSAPKWLEELMESIDENGGGLEDLKQVIDKRNN